MVDRRHAWALPLLLSACVVTGTAGEFEEGTSTGGGGIAPTTAEPGDEASTFADTEKPEVPAPAAPTI